MADKKNNNNEKGKSKFSTLDKLEVFNAGLMGYMGQMYKNSITASQSKIASISYNAQKDLVIQAANRQTIYDNEALAQNVWNAYEQKNQLLSAQSTAVGSSGFADISTGDQRLFADTIRRTDDYVAGLNKSAENATFERNRTAMMEATRLEYAAKMQDVVRKYTSGWRGQLSNISSGLMSGLGQYYTVWGRNEAINAQNSVNQRLAANV